MTLDTKLTPMMAQWQSCKEKAGSSLLLFRMGDFYEAFYEDAQILARVAEVTLTQRQSTPMAGIPFHSAEGYIDKLVQAGICVAIAEQIEDPKTAKGLVKRDIVKVVTPGTIVSSSFLSENKNNYFVSLTQIGSLFGLSFIDVTTSDFKAIESDSLDKIKNELFGLQPSEILASKKFIDRHQAFFEDLKLSFNFLLTAQDEWTFDYQLTYTNLVEHFKVHNLDGFGLKGQNSAINAAGSLLTYLKDGLNLCLNHINSLSTFNPSSYLSLDRTTLKNLELIESSQMGSKKHSLLGVLDHTATPMGARLLRSWILQPLQDLNEILKRQEAIEALLNNTAKIFEVLKYIKDIQRLLTRVETSIASPRDVVALRISLEYIPQLKSLFQDIKPPLIDELKKQLHDLKELTFFLKNALYDDVPAKISEGDVFKAGFNAKLDELRDITTNGKSWLMDYQNKLREETQIKTLKVSFTSAFGYFIEVSKGQATKMPSTFQRRQTLVNAERFTTPELKEYEEKVLSAEDLRIKLEMELFKEVSSYIATFSLKIHEIAKSIANIDVLSSLAHVAKYWGYSKPTLDNSYELNILAGRHPIIESTLLQQSFTANDTHLNDQESRLILLTGPNMAGKSTYIRQVALIALMAHMGSFVPAKFAHIGLIDKIFTRIGASDDLSRGQSTFMVEMTETANILHHATTRSLVILDEIGRGTSTYDGISIAWSTAEYLLKELKPRTLFATHYFELTALEDEHFGAQNFNVLVSEDKDGISFLHKIAKGSAAKSYGIHVARLAGMPHNVVERAKVILNELENAYGKDRQNLEPLKKNKQKKDESQMLLFGHV
jgi:DNA mismatch repair protein MutS